MTPAPTNMNTTELTSWPSRPANEVFPPLLDTIRVAQLLLYDQRGRTPEQARRSVRELVKKSGLPSLGRIGSTLMFRQTDVVGWLATRNDVDEDANDAKVGAT